MLLQATDDVAQRAFAVFRRGCARIATGHLPGGAHSVVVNGTTVTCTAPPHCDAARNSTKTKASSSAFVFGDLSVMGPLLNRDAQRWNCSVRNQRTQRTPFCPFLLVGEGRTASAAPLCITHKVRNVFAANSERQASPLQSSYHKNQSGMGVFCGWNRFAKRPFGVARRPAQIYAWSHILTTNR